MSRSHYPFEPGWQEDGTSREAAESMSEHAPTLRQMAFDFLCATPGHLADQVAAGVGKTPYAIRPRISELWAMGMITNCGRGINQPSGKPAYTWAPTEAALKLSTEGLRERLRLGLGVTMRLKQDLRPYQERIATALYENDEKLCVLRMGGGKTVAALTAIAELLRDKVIRHALVIAPKRVAQAVWPDEIASWAHIAKLRYAVLDGTPAQRMAMLGTAGQRDLTIIGVDNVQWLMKAMENAQAENVLFDLLVIDEISRLRDPRGKQAQAVAKYAECWKMVWGLTGTLRPNGPIDMYMPARIVTRGKLWGRSFDQWRKANFYPADYNGYDWLPFPGGALERLETAIAPLIVTAGEDELKQPEATIIFDRVELPPGARAQYREMERKLFATVDDDNKVVAASTAIATGKLAQIANGFLYEDDTVHLIHAAKREWLDDLILTATEPTLLVYEYREDLAVLRELVPSLRYLGGGTSDANAAAAIAEWNAGRLPFMALHPMSGGHGLNLQHGGAAMAWISPTWSPEYWEQTIARLNRSGQTRQVIVRVCVAGDTVDQMKLDRVHGKMTAQAAFEAYLQRHQAQTA